MFSELLLKPCAIITWFLPSNIKLLFTGNATSEFSKFRYFGDIK